MLNKKWIRLICVFISMLILSACQPASQSSTQTLSSNPISTIAVNINGQPKIKRLFAIECRSYAVLEDGSFWQWGGDDEKNAIYYPVKLDFPAEVKKIIGDDVRFALLTDGSLWSWGENFRDGWLGDGTTKARNKPIQILEGVKDIYRLTNEISYTESKELAKQKISVTQTYSIFALKNDGSVWAWGRNTEGQLGDGSYINRLEPTNILNNIEEIYASDHIVSFLKDDGSLLMKKDKIGTDETPNTTLWDKKIDAVYKVAPQYTTSIAYINEKGELFQYCKTVDNVEFTKKLMDDVADVRCFDKSAYVALKKDGTLYFWKYNPSDVTTLKDIPEPEKLKSDVAKIIYSDEEKLCVMTNNKNVLYSKSKNFDFKVIAENVTQLAVGAGHFLMISAKDNKFYGWGSCVYGQLGVDLNPGETELKQPVEILFPATWQQ